MGISVGLGEFVPHILAAVLALWSYHNPQTQWVWGVKQFPHNMPMLCVMGASLMLFLTLICESIF
jgi:hypothetical protein